MDALLSETTILGLNMITGPESDISEESLATTTIISSASLMSADSTETTNLETTLAFIESLSIEQLVEFEDMLSQKDIEFKISTKENNVAIKKM